MYLNPSKLLEDVSTTNLNKWGEKIINKRRHYFSRG